MYTLEFGHYGDTSNGLIPLIYVKIYKKDTSA